MKTGYLITARLKSKRLKKKILLDIDEDRVLDKVIKRCKSVTGINNIILCTSTNPQDAELQNVAEMHRIGFFRGDEEDVLKRLLDAAKAYNLDNFLSITADNPLHSVSAANEIIAFNRKNDFDFIFTYNLPIGIGPYFLKTDALDIVVYIKKEKNTEIWGPFVNQPSFFKIGNLFFNINEKLRKTRITCDYNEDYQFIKELFKHFKVKDLPDMKDISKLYSTHPEIFSINKGIQQRSISNKAVKEIQDSFFLYTDKAKSYAKNKGIKLTPELIEKHIVLKL